MAKSPKPKFLLDTPEATSIDESQLANCLIGGDCLNVLPKLPDASVDCVFVDPPYFLQLPKKRLQRWSGSDVDAVEDSWDTFEDFAAYDDFTRRYLTQLQRIMKPTGTIWIIGTYHNIHRVGTIMQDLGFWMLNDIVWFKNNPMPNFRKVRFTNATETLLWAVRDKKAKKYTYHADYAKSLNENKLGINVWRLPLCSGRERLRDEEGNKIHSTQKPLELLRRVILSATDPGDLILDPMAGSGTTGAAAQELDRRFLLIERNEHYLTAIKQRLKIK